MLVGKKLGECFSQQKDELILGFRSENESLYLKASLLPDFACLSVQREFHRARRNSINLFQQLLGCSVLDIYQALNERTFIINFDSNKILYFKMHGNRSNILYFEGDSQITMFKQKLVNDKALTVSNIDRPIDQSFEAFEKSAGNYEQLFPTFGKLVKQFLQQQEYDNKTLPEQWDSIQDVLKALNSSEFYILEKGGKLVFSLIPTAEIVETFHTPVDAINHFYHSYLKHFTFNQQKATLIKSLETQIKKTDNYIQKTNFKLSKLENSRKNDEIANIIMANLHQIPANSTKVKLFDFYQDKTIEIKLKLGLTPQKNAEQYYRKAKNQKLETDQLKQNIAKKIKELKAATKQLETVSDIEDFKSLKAYQKGKSSLTNKPQKNLPYRKLTFQGFDILIGKSAASNDELTQKVAKKDDLWLHAKDVSGSHVVIKGAGKQHFPKPVIEFAAALAAFYSKRKNDSLCPVIYTAKKHVRKPKYALPGQVVVEKEQVILVEPKNFSE